MEQKAKPQSLQEKVLSSFGVHEGMYAAKVSVRVGITANLASTILCRLATKGLLMRSGVDTSIQIKTGFWTRRKLVVYRLSREGAALAKVLRQKEIEGS